MTTESTMTAKPDLQQTLPGRSRAYRLYGQEYVEFDAFFGTHPLVVQAPWGVSYTQELGENYQRTGKIEMHVYDVRTEQGVTIKHPLYGTTYDTDEAARRAAFEDLYDENESARLDEEMYGPNPR
jgi:hypothetical protein